MEPNVPSETPQSEPTDGPRDGQAISDPMAVVRMAQMARRVEEELQSIELDDRAASRLSAIDAEVTRGLSDALSDDLAGELERLLAPVEDGPRSTDGARVAHRQLTGWLHGLLVGAQYTVMTTPDTPPQPDGREMTSTIDPRHHQVETSIGQYL